MIKKLIGINYNTSGTSGTSGVSGTTNVLIPSSGISGSSGTAGTTGTAFVGSQTDIYSGNFSYNWSKPIGAKVVEVICIGAGGSGGSGSVNASNRYGGGGGAGGGYSRMIFNASSLPSTVNVIRGTGFSGGASKTIVSNGNNGSTGGDSYFGDYLRATGGAGGLGGSSLDTAQSIGGYGVIENGGKGGVVATSNTKYAPSGGGAGGDGSGFGGAGGSDGGVVRLQINTQGQGAAPGLPGGTASSYTNQLMGAGGGGGGGGSGTNGGAGANGLLYGAGGGGGGSSNGTSGAGGSGANGVVIVITYF